MQESRKKRWLAPWRRRNTTAWGSLLDEQEILLAALSLQQSGGVRVLMFEHVRAPEGLRDAAQRDDWLVQTRPGYIGDARYAMLPTAIDPIWGISWDAAGRVMFSSNHAMSQETRARWLAMLLGRP